MYGALTLALQIVLCNLWRRRSFVCFEKQGFTPSQKRLIKGNETRQKLLFCRFVRQTKWAIPLFKVSVQNRVFWFMRHFTKKQNQQKFCQITLRQTCIDYFDYFTDSLAPKKYLKFFRFFKHFCTNLIKCHVSL